MNPGKLNRRITIQQRALTRDAVGGKVETWADVRNVSAELVMQKGSESVIANSDRATRDTQFRIRHFTGLNEQDFRILYQLRFYDIQAIEPEGIKTGMLVTCRQTQAVTA